jgi:cytochrome c oxidase subunit IV
MEKPDQSHSVTAYIVVFGALIVLTLFTYFLSTLHLEHSKAIILAAIISVTKCSLIAAFFMHLKFDSKNLTYVVFTAVFLVGTLILTLIPDIGLIK